MIVLFAWMFGATFLSTAAITPFISRVYQADGDYHLTKIAVDNDHNLFIGGKNILLKLSEDLEERQTPYQLFGPVTESYGQKCKGPLYGDGDCSTRQVNNTVSVLVSYPFDRILVCGTAFQGLCSVHSKSNMSDWTYLPHDTEYGFFRDSLLGSHEGNNVVIFTDQTDPRIHYVASSFERKPGEFHSHIFSALIMNSFSGHYYFNHHNRNSEGAMYLNMNTSYEGDFNTDMVYGFETTDYVFFIFNRKSGPNTFEARIARITRNCSSMYFQTYIELSLICNYEKKLMTNQPVLSGHLHITPEGNQILFLAFYNPITEGSSVCAYPVKDLNSKSFIFAVVNCRNGINDDVHAPYWVSHTNELCSDPKDRSSWGECGSIHYRGLSSKEFSCKAKRFIFLEKQKIATMHVTHDSYDQKPVIMLGTSEGKLHKVEVSGYNDSISQSRHYATFDLSGDRSVPIEKSLGIDHRKEHLYFLVDNKVMKISLNSCGIHADCNSCVNSMDPLGCGWCGDDCTTQTDCNKTQWHNQWHNISCPPEVYRISPRNGTTDGQTHVTIDGRYFNSGWGNLHVLIGGNECQEPAYNSKSIVCETSAAARGESSVVIVEISNNTHSLQSITKNVTFEYLIPSFEDFYPKHGPKSGYTSLTLTGQNLDIGSSLTIDVSDSQSICKLKRKENDIIVCELTRWTSTNTGVNPNQSAPSHCLGYGPVTIYIDETALSSKEDFCYMDDPIIDIIAPVSTTIGGGRIVSVTGQNFDAVLMTRLKIVVRNNESYEELESQKCKVINPRLLKCAYPSLRKVLSGASSGVSVNLTLELDGGIPLQNADRRIMVYNDPVLFPVTKNISFNNDERIMVLHGRFLNMAFGISDYNVSVEGLSCPVLELESDRLVCNMLPVLDGLDVNQNRVFQVKVNVGPFLMELGDLKVTMHTRLAIVSTPGYQNWLWVGIIIAVFLILILVCVIVRSKRKRKKRNYVTNIDIEGTMTFQNLIRIETDEPSSVPNNYIHIGQEDEAIGGEPANLIVDIETVDMLKKQNLLVSRDNLLLGESLGHGQFGCVYKGFLSSPGAKGEQIVAVKTILKSSAKEVDIGEFINEALIMKDFNHPNVLSLMGVCIDKGEFPLVILPFMENGDLLAYIRDEHNMPLVKDLVFFGLDIAKGMEYLSSIKFVHRDLAARNCMLDENFFARVADFGLSRDIYSNHYYSSDNKKKLPVKWMAPESLEKGKYSSKSDVWSFGVVLWELITRGANPYPAVDNWDMYTYLKEGRRLPKTPFCPPRLFQIMVCCWEFNPSKRPTFRDLIKEIKRLLKESENEEHSICDVTVDLESATMTS
ncbi:hepatocyte growth factor receptor-like [Ylistrum balloti]|uniref:hepatocyte growth factor receptor-like n=1 Tax=Ylistrum balloti TaxID=509963 RepID=UPI00290586FD|nr:hepatocyte growth factor receptor-like [Ylistrum balloti]